MPISLEFIWQLFLQMENLVQVYFNYQLHASFTDHTSGNWQRDKCVYCIVFTALGNVKSVTKEFGREDLHTFL